MIKLSRWLTADRRSWRPCAAYVALLVIGASMPLSVKVAAQSDVAIVAGPMPGYVAMRSARLWLQTNGPADIAIDYWPVGRPEQAKSTTGHEALAERDFSLAVSIGDLDPGQTYEYRVRVNGTEQTLPDPLRFRTMPFWQRRSDPPLFTVALGSCAYLNDAPYEHLGEEHGGGYEIFETIARLQPEMMLWLGDNIYLREPDYDSPEGFAYRYRTQRGAVELQRLLRATHHVATWDDHEFGPNNSNRSYRFKDTALALFQRYWVNPSYGMPDVPGVFTVVNYGDVDFFLLDDRYYRDADEAPNFAGKSMLGEAQLRWLKNALLSSPATFKFIVNGSQMLDKQPGIEGWSNFPAEKQAFFDWLAESDISGVVLLAGDRHMSKLIKHKRFWHYPLYELTCSPLTSSPRDPASEPNPEVVEGTYIGERNFCTLNFHGARKDRTLTIRVFSTTGELRWEKKLAAKELRD